MMRKSVLLPFVAALFPSVAIAETDYQSVISAQINTVEDILKNGKAADFFDRAQNPEPDGYDPFTPSDQGHLFLDADRFPSDPYWLHFQGNEIVAQDQIYATFVCTRLGQETVEAALAASPSDLKRFYFDTLLSSQDLDGQLDNWPDGMSAMVTCTIILNGPSVGGSTSLERKALPDLETFSAPDILNGLGFENVTSIEAVGGSRAKLATPQDRIASSVVQLDLMSSRTGAVGLRTTMFLKSTLN